MSPDPIPDAWPPESWSEERQVVPLFPLANVWLFPRAVMPLHIFEPRYRQMIEDSLDGPGRIVMGTVVEGQEHDMSGSPPIHAVAGLGEIVRHERLPDGRFHIHLWGLGRVNVREVESDRMYRKVEIEPLMDAEVARAESDDLRVDLMDAIRVRSGQLLDLPADVPIGFLADLLILRLQLPHALLQELYADPDPASRARRALDEHGRRGVEDSPEE